MLLTNEMIWLNNVLDKWHPQNLFSNKKFSLKFIHSQSIALHMVKKKSKSFPRQWRHRAAPISVSIALGHASADAVKATAGGWSTGSSACLNAYGVPC